MSHATGTGFSFISKILLALASVASYELVGSLAEAIKPLAVLPNTGSWFPYVAGAIFGGFVLMPYVGAERRAIRIAGLWIAGGLIYRLAIWFAVDGSPDFGSPLVTLIITGAGAAVLCALAVVLIASQPWQPIAFAWALLAGALGGASFELNIPADTNLLVSHGIWQLLVCLALHAGFERRLPA